MNAKALLRSVDERGGSPSVEAALMAILFGVIIMFGIAAGRFVAAESAADQAAFAAARAASIQRDPAAAQAQAQAMAERTLREQGLACTDLTVTVDTSQFSRPLGTPAIVRATVRCDVRWSDLVIPAPGSRAVQAEFASPIDQLRERS